MSISPKVSIIIPVFNGSKYMREAIDSALNQSYGNIEIIVVNDGSNDNGDTEKVALTYNERIRYLCKPNGGVASALNMALEYAKGEYISWLSHDDLYVDSKIERQIKLFDEINQKDCILYSDYSVFYSNSSEDFPVYLEGVDPKYFRYWLTIKNVLHGCTLLIPKRAFELCGKFNENLKTTQDYDLWFRMAEKFKFIHCPNILVKARAHPEQGSITMRSIAHKECDALLSEFVKNLREDEILLSENKSLYAAYLKISSSMYIRNFYTSASIARSFAIKHWKIADSNFDNTKSFLLYLGVKYSKISDVFKKYFLFPVLKGKSMFKRILKKFFNKIKFQFIKKNDEIDSLKKLNVKEKFTTVYENNLFRGSKSKSGEGSDLIQTKIIRNAIPVILNKYQVTSILDAPCGDWFWMSMVDLSKVKYIGADIVDNLIVTNNMKYGSNTISFKCLNLIDDELPKTDLILSRDCLVHLSFIDSCQIIRNFKKSGAKYLLTTTFNNRKHNSDLGGGFWRPLNMQLPPFNFPKPIELIDEGCSEDNRNFSDKCLGLWLLSDINI